MKTIKGIHKLNRQSIVLYIIDKSGKCLSDLFAWLGSNTDKFSLPKELGK